MPNEFAKIVLSSDGEQVLVFMMNHPRDDDEWSCTIMTSYSGPNEGASGRTFSSFMECRAFFDAFDTAEADNELDVVQRDFVAGAISYRAALKRWAKQAQSEAIDLSGASEALDAEVAGWAAALTSERDTIAGKAGQQAVDLAVQTQPI